MRLSSTSTERTYRYLRLAILGAVAVLGVAVVAVDVVDGPVTSFSALFYTPGRTMFTGALCAITLALLALSGHSVEQVLLDVAAPFAALIAVVPTPIAAGDVRGVTPDCGGGAPCVPPGELTGVAVGIAVLAVVGAAGIVTALVLARLRHTATAGVAAGLAAAAVVVVGMPVWLVVAPGSLLESGHDTVTGVFFGLMIAVAVVSAITTRGRLHRVYLVVAVGMAAGIGYLTVVFFVRRAGAAPSPVPWVLIGETVIVGLFCVLWIAQTVQKWHEADPAAEPGSGIPATPTR